MTENVIEIAPLILRNVLTIIQNETMDTDRKVAMISREIRIKARETTALNVI